MMNNRDIYQKDPATRKLVNEGVASVNDEKTSQALAVLRYELETFVCDGQYEKGWPTSSRPTCRTSTRRSNRLFGSVVFTVQVNRISSKCSGRFGLTRFLRIELLLEA